ncbi:MAG: hypothetical protein ACERKZ_18730 [Lachnotalea sp.]
MIEIIERESKHTLWDDYRSIGTSEWNVLQNGLLKLFVYPVPEGVILLFISHHLLGDGRCLLDLVNEFVDLYAESVKPAYVSEQLIQQIKDLPSKSELTGVSKYLIRNLNQKWRKEKKHVSYEKFQEFTNQFAIKNPVSHETSTINQNELQLMKIFCKENNVTINDLLMAKLYIGMDIRKIIIAADIRSKLSCYHKSACGNYATAMGIVCKSKNTDILKKVKEIHKLVQIHLRSNKKLMLVLSCYLKMDAGLIDAAAIATLGEFESKVARFVGGNMFGFTKRDGISISNLGGIKNNNIIDATFIPPASPATIMAIGVLSVNDRMQLCSSYYQNLISSRVVKDQLKMLGSI